MATEPNLQEIMVDLPKEKFLIDFADNLFKDKDNSRDIRFTLNEITNKDGSPLPTMKIVIEDKLTLFFYKKNDIWEYDGWEMGNYKNYWTKGSL